MDNSQAIKHEIYVENDEEFDFTSYNDITVISGVVGIPTSQLLFELREKFTGKVTGTYGHPLLVNLCMWANEEYAFKVDMIMNYIYAT